jgi:isopentenyl-diphosphate delta-isomerase
MDQNFVQRKEDHLHFSLNPDSQTSLFAQFDQFDLIHDSMPELNLNEVSIRSHFLDSELATPFFVSGMTAGHENANLINDRIAMMASERGWIMGVGSQRRELDSTYEDQALQKLSIKYPKLKLISNLGLSQLITLHQNNAFSKLSKLIEKSGSLMIAIHLNPLQEAIQAEGTPNFKGGLEALKAWKKISPVPVMVKETGSGMSEVTFLKLKSLDLFAIDLSGMGGTHWGRIEGLRAKNSSLTTKMGKTFGEWGVSTVESLLDADQIFKGTSTEIWASGGVRSGLDAAKAIAMGAQRVGFAQPVLKAAMESEVALMEFASEMEQGLKISMFCTNSKNLTELNSSKVKGFR